jgi:hypothetical protein
MYSTNFLVAVAERAIKTFAQTLLATIGADAAGVFTASTLDAVTVAAGAALISVLTSFASASTGRTGPSLAGETTAPDLYITKSDSVKSAVRDGDGDGLVNDGKKTQAPAPAKKKAPAKKAASGKKPE